MAFRSCALGEQVLCYKFHFQVVKTIFYEGAERVSRIVEYCLCCKKMKNSSFQAMEKFSFYYIDESIAVCANNRKIINTLTQNRDSFITDQTSCLKRNIIQKTMPFFSSS